MCEHIHGKYNHSDKCNCRNPSLAQQKANTPVIYLLDKIIAFIEPSEAFVSAGGSWAEQYSTQRRGERKRIETAEECCRGYSQGKLLIELS